jgi:FkbM family methyltransferase
MSFVSYSQNYEDVMLWRALNHITAGFYIDIGANDPVIDSVTRAFYDTGWRGINIDCLSSHLESLLKERSEDINLLCAVGDKTGEIDIFECDVRGWATGDKETSEKHIEEGRQGRYHRVPIRTLAGICQEFVRGEIHFLKIDVEGMEKEVVLGADFQRFRPWIIVLEATKPNSTEETYEEWEPSLLRANYHFAYADGLNRFYVSHEHSELMPSFRYPPNIFDEFIRIEQLNSEIRAQDAENKAQDAENKAQDAENKAQELDIRLARVEEEAQEALSKAKESETRAEQSEAKAKEYHEIVHEAEIRAEQAQAALAIIYNSRLWRMTAPWRWAGNKARWFKAGCVAWLTFAPGCRPRRCLRQALLSIKLKIYTRPLLKVLVAKLLSRFPKISSHLHSIGGHGLSGNFHNIRPIGNDLTKTEKLSPMAQKIYNDLKSAIKKCHKEQF